ncbi:hypothetical protein RU97_GL001752 [Enterococcus canis]|uniref:Uncharacterized protein n=1 Tax=Enterococcus canis TaxID=214095 RepID=A0A1L8RF91_9ENTE|nr:hypothetical protein [Enterococcus canis]OJG18355.1 hypothetical protein RU97_GL001752 [Enterococcus canis]
MKDNIEIWGDAVSLKDLIRAILFCVVPTMGAYFIAPAGDTTKQLFFGLGGAVVGFILAAVFIKPKRHVVEKEAE